MGHTAVRCMGRHWCVRSRGSLRIDSWVNPLKPPGRRQGAKTPATQRLPIGNVGVSYLIMARNSALIRRASSPRQPDAFERK